MLKLYRIGMREICACRIMPIIALYSLILPTLDNGIVKLVNFNGPSKTTMLHPFDTMIKNYLYTNTKTKHVQSPTPINSEGLIKPYQAIQANTQTCDQEYHPKHSSPSSTHSSHTPRQYVPRDPTDKYPEPTNSSHHPHQRKTSLAE